MAVVKCAIPPSSMLDRHSIESAYFWDSYCAPLNHRQSDIIEIFTGIFAHHPIWIKIILIIRNWIASCCGLEAAGTSDILHAEFKKKYNVGEKVGVWPIFLLNENELIAGRNNKHLDFRLSISKVVDGETTSVIVSTICMVNNTFGKIYLFFIVPFHKWGVQQLISRAINAGRL